MQAREPERLTDPELHELFDTLFPNSVAGEDVLAELAPAGWEQSPLVACFHPPVERVFEEQLRPIKPTEELTELVGLCLWDVFSDNHDVIAADGRVADIGSFRGAGAFLDEYLTGRGDTWCKGDYMRFYMGTFAVDGRADLTPVFAMIFRRLKALGADWIYHFPDLLLVELGSPDAEDESPKRYSPNEALAAASARARKEARDQPPPSIVRAYRAVYGRDPSGWPPA